jgi:hypothetical protein
MLRYLALFGLLMTQPVWAAVEFDNADDIITLTSSSAMDTLWDGPLSFSMWVNLDSTGEGTGGYLLNKGNNAAGTNRLFRTLPTDAIHFLVNGTSLMQRITNNNAFSLNTWTNFIVTWDGSMTATNVHIYVNGTEASYATSTNGTTIATVATQTARIGNSGDSARTADGHIDEIYMFNKVLSAAEITLLQSRVRKTGLQISGVTFYYALDDCSDGSSANGVTFSDAVGNADAGTGDDGANNTGLTCAAGEVLSYP